MFAQNREKAQGLGSGVTRGVKGLASSVADGVSGVVAQPYAGAQSEGVWGFGKLSLLIIP